MKQLFTLLFFVLSFQSFGQTFAPIGATWHYSEFFALPLNYQESFMKFEVTGDTVIGGQSCSIIHKEGKVACYSRPDDEYVYIANDTVFVYDPHFLDFRVLYDFNANAGDTWETIVFGADFATDLDTNVIVVDSTDFIQVNGQNLKRLFVTYQFSSEGFTYSYPSIIVERFGDTHYLFNYYTDQLQVCDMNYSGGLRCYEDSFLGLYESGIADSCEYIEPYVGLSEMEQNAFSIAPNPATDFIKIESKTGDFDRIILTDVNGRNILDTETATISVAHLESGIYFVNVLQNGTWSQQRFLKQD